MDDKKQLFESDRRQQLREDGGDRRTRLRPTTLLKIRGALIAALFFLLIAAVIYFTNLD